jgi:hypothetical protein
MDWAHEERKSTKRNAAISLIIFKSLDCKGSNKNLLKEA